MTYVIAEPCIDVKDKGCVEVCPCDWIHGDEDSPQLYINPGDCIDCGACESECPTAAIFYEGDLPAQWKQYAQINADYYADK